MPGAFLKLKGHFNCFSQAEEGNKILIYHPVGLVTTYIEGLMPSEVLIKEGCKEAESLGRRRKVWFNAKCCTNPELLG